MGDALLGGIDLKEAEARAIEGSQAALRGWRDLNAEIREHPAVFFAALNGVALGGGLTMAGVCELTVSNETASFGMPEVGFGRYPNPAGPTAQFSMPRKRVAWLVRTPECLDAVQAEAWGLINEVVRAEVLESRVEAIVSRVAKFDAVALRGCKFAQAQISLAVRGWRAQFAAGVLAHKRIEVDGDPTTAVVLFTHGSHKPERG